MEAVAFPPGGDRSSAFVTASAEEGAAPPEPRQTRPADPATRHDGRGTICLPRKRGPLLSPFVSYRVARSFALKLVSLFFLYSSMHCFY